MRKAFDDTADVGSAPSQPIDLGERLLPCAFCGTPAKHKVLATLGARCSPCFRAYCEAPPQASNVGDKRTGGPRAWAYALKAREEAGERLSGVQRRMWRAAIGECAE